jgi:hypothetical protein
VTAAASAPQINLRPASNPPLVHVEVLNTLTISSAIDQLQKSLSKNARIAKHNDRGVEDLHSANWSRA